MSFDRTSFLRSAGFLRTLTAIEACHAGIVTSHDEWIVYRSNPIRWAIGAPPARIDALCRWLETSHRAIETPAPAPVPVAPGIEKVFTP